MEWFRDAVLVLNILCAAQSWGKGEYIFVLLNGGVATLMLHGLATR